MTKALADMGQKVDYAIDVDVPDENIVRRYVGKKSMCGMRSYISCGICTDEKRRHL